MKNYTANNNARSFILAGALLGFAGFAACEKKQAPAPSAAPAAAAGEDLAFEAQWKTLAGNGIEAVYIEDDKGEGLMGNVRRASDMRPDPAKDEAIALADKDLPDSPPGEKVQQIIRGNLAAVKGCYMTMARAGSPRSGKAIVSFGIGADGRTTDVKVVAPSFSGTNLPKCMGGQVARWAFPKSQKGGGAVSYPFVFVGG